MKYLLLFEIVNEIQSKSGSAFLISLFFVFFFVFVCFAVFCCFEWMAAGLLNCVRQLVIHNQFILSLILVFVAGIKYQYTKKRTTKIFPLCLILLHALIFHSIESKNRKYFFQQRWFYKWIFSISLKSYLI